MHPVLLTQLSYQAARAYNLAASLGRFMFPALPVIPADLMEVMGLMGRSVPSWGSCYAPLDAWPTGNFFSQS